MGIEKLLIVAPHYPPSSMPPAQRVRMIVNHLEECNIQPIVITTHPKYLEEVLDPAIVDMTNSNTPCIRVRAISSKFSRKLGFGDLGLRMLPFLLFGIPKACRKHKIDYVLYLVPPWYILILAPIAKLLTGKPYAVDFIDPWVQKDSGFSGIKDKISQKVASYLEGWVLSGADYFYSVSKAINKEILARHAQLKIETDAIPYGVELNDFENVSIDSAQSIPFNFKYIGAVWPKAYPVLDALFKAFKILKDESRFHIDFIGTSYAGGDLSRNQLDSFIQKNGLDQVISESSHRVPYSKVIELYKNSDALFIFGDTGDQYAASKLMPIIASKRPFFAFLHEDSYPYQVLEQLNFEFLVGYSNSNGNLPKDVIPQLVDVIRRLINESYDFVPYSFDNEILKNNSASGMTSRIVDGINKSINKA